MSEEKLYAVKNDEGQYLLDSSLSMDYPEWTSDLDGTEIFVERHNAVTASNSSGGHVVTFVEEPEKVTVSPNEAKAIESLLNANAYIETLYPFRYLFTSRNKEDIKRLIKAIKNGYTVAKPKMYLVYEKLGGKTECDLITQAMWEQPNTIFWEVSTCISDDNRHRFTREDIERLGLQKYEKREARGDDDGIR